MAAPTVDSHDFEMPSPKRQRTSSPIEKQPKEADAPVSMDHAAIAVEQQNAPVGQGNTNELPSAAVPDSHDMLDLLMQHVESEAAAKAALSNPNGPQPASTDHTQHHLTNSNESAQDVRMGDTSLSGEIGMTIEQTQAQPHKEQLDLQPPARNHTDDAPLPPGLEATDSSTADHLRTVAEMNSLPPTADTLVEAHIPSATEVAFAATDEQPEAREWETDSSPYNSDSSDTTSDSDDSSDSDEDDADDYTLLDPHEQARILMAEDGGGGGDSDDEGNSRPNRTTNTGGAGLRTTNEQTEAILPKPDVVVTEDMKIEELGATEAVVENIVLIRAKVTGEYQVLESGSVLCLADRSVIGAIAETLGRVEQPLYTVRFASQTDINESGVQEKGIKIFYVKDHSTFVFTQPLKAVKGSDASNFHDEEVGDEEMEFSDDEAEAEHKRQLKLRRKGIDPSTIPARGRGGRGGRGQRGGPAGRGGYSNATGNNYMSNIPESDTASMYGNGSVEMNYDDVEEGETEYTPLRRPETLSNHSAMNGNTQPQTSPPSQSSYPPRNNRGNHNQDRGGRSRGGRNRGTSNNNRARGRGGQNNYNNINNTTPNYAQTNGYTPSSMYQPQPQQQPQYYPPHTQQQQQQQQAYFGFQAPPPPPQLTPSYSNATNTVPPSPMTPLPQGQGNYNFNFHQAAHNQWAQYHQNQNNSYAAQQAQYGTNVNADALAQVQRQLEELQRSTQQGGTAGSGWNAQARQQ